MNAQDNLLKSDDGFYANIQPKADAIEEVTVSMAGVGAESAGEGAAQVKFITRSGGNQFHGGTFGRTATRRSIRITTSTRSTAYRATAST